jgi:erythromycin esterase-like protein
VPGSYEALMHETGRHFLLPMQAPAADLLTGPQLERAIGVIYRPHTERESHWFHARMPEQFDAIVHIDQSTAVEPLERTSRWDAGEPPETYPTGL